MGEYTFARGDVDESISIMREAAGWLIDLGEPLWSLDELNRESLTNPPEEFIVMYDGEHAGVATMLLSTSDRLFWPEVPAGSSGFIHKLAIRRRFAGGGLTKHLIDFAVEALRDRGIHCVRLDCDAGRERLCGFYESLGFARVRRQRFNTPKHGAIDVAFYEYHF